MPFPSRDRKTAFCLAGADDPRASPTIICKSSSQTMIRESQSRQKRQTRLGRPRPGSKDVAEDPRVPEGRQKFGRMKDRRPADPPSALGIVARCVTTTLPAR
ncbi:MAG: hypothetical protein HS102_00895 [Planctomycetia bacterium]|nr:MAG: hypothetical protein EDS66_11870 [Planctomycetota bacterium]KAB2937239.1 MAG: hypothetical protein F9K17_16285 [Phycisphaerae bacterium]MBE7455181.1 hypothetical protein [Planctomycetia bacterium]MCK6465926.1 hypothetical protein [Phycisphaerae bacterium]MCQ3921971.1 hypothetical protein [Planctomycetota bacterium]